MNAGRTATGEVRLEQVGREIFDCILDAASGNKRTRTERWGLHNALALFNPGPVT